MGRKPWRRIRTGRMGEAVESASAHSSVIRKVCYGILILELAVLVQRVEIPVVEVSRWQEEIVVEQSENVYGLRLRLKEGVLELYQKQYQKQE